MVAKHDTRFGFWGGDALASMISVHTLDEAAARRLFAAALGEAQAKIEGLTAKVAAEAGTASRVAAGR